MSVVLDLARASLVSSAGGLLLRETVRASGARRAMSEALAPWRGARAVHDPGKVLVDVAVAIALGGDCLADVAVLRAQPALFGQVASDPTVSRLVARLAGDIETTLPAIRAARAQAREAVWARRRPLAGTPGSRDGGQVIVDLDATLVTAHSDKQSAQPTYKRGYGFAPMCAFVDHGEYGTGETLLLQLRRDPAMAARAGSFDVVKVAHHGSGNLDEDLVAQVAAPLAVISVGAGNDYGHPSPRALEVLRRNGYAVQRTDQRGDVAVVVTGDDVGVTWRRR